MLISASERGLVRLFAVDLPSEQIPAFCEPIYDEDGAVIRWPLIEALGATYLDQDFVEIFDIDDLEDLGLTGYMTDGLGIAEADLVEDGARLSAQTGWVMVIVSSAFKETEQALNPHKPLRWLGTYKEEGAPVHFEPLLSNAASESAPEGDKTPPPPNPRNPYVTVMAALVALPILAVLIGALAMWMF
ncbi:hypothetical protein [Shimia sp.]|uniref:hypothetical protein n=1 Tax=Shimia sp. TaxID=1954381 RepID=UPI003B8DD90D